jgi:hypothetical protein
MSSIEVEPIDGPDEGVPIDGLAAELTRTVGLADDTGPGDMVSDQLASDIEEYDAHAGQRDEHLAEQVEDEHDEQVEQPQGRKHVPLGALHEERGKRQAAQAEAEQLRQQLAAHQQQLAQFQAWQQQLAAQQQQAQQQAEIPAFVDDPEGHINARLQQIEQAQQATVQRAQFEQARAHVGQQLQQAAPVVMQIEAEFTAQHPDYSEAYEHLNREVDARMALQHPHATPEQHAFAKQWAMYSFLQNCADTGQSPAALIYSEAQRLGFRSQHRAPAISAKRAPTSLGAIPGGSLGPDDHGRPSAKSIATMSDAEFDRLWSQMEADSVQRPY